MLVDQVDYELGPSLDELSDEAIVELVKKRAEAKLQEICIRPLGQLAGSDILHVSLQWVPPSSCLISLRAQLRTAMRNRSAASSK